MSPHTGTGKASACGRALLAGAALAMAASQAAAQAYPTRPVRVIVPFTAGGSTDILARPIASQLADALGQPFLIDNRGGANTIIGAEIMAKANPDGHTLLVAPQNLLCINPHVYRKLPYDVKRDFAPVAMLIEYNYVMVARPNLAQKTVPELIAYAKANPGKLSHGTTGEGSSGHVAQLLLEQMAGVKINHIPYKGNAPMIADLMGGSLDIAMLGYAPIQGQIQSGKLRLIAAAAEKRMADLPDLPTVAEAGYAGFTSGTWFSFVTRAGTPAGIVTRLNTETNKAMRSNEFVTAIAPQKAFIHNGSPDDLAKKIAFESGRWEKVTKAVGLMFD